MARFTKYLFISVLLATSAFISLRAAHTSPRLFTVDSLEFNYRELLQLRLKDKVHINSGEYKGIYSIQEDSYETKELAPGPLSTSQEPLIYIMGRKIVLVGRALGVLRKTISFYFENSLKDQPIMLEDQDGNPIDKAKFTQHPYIIKQYFNAQTTPRIRLGEETSSVKKFKKDAIELVNNVMNFGFLRRVLRFSSAAPAQQQLSANKPTRAAEQRADEPVNYQEIQRLPEGAKITIAGIEYRVEKIELVTKTMEVAVAYGLKVPYYKIFDKNMVLAQVSNTPSCSQQMIILSFKNENEMLFTTADECEFVCTHEPTIQYTTKEKYDLACLQQKQNELIARDIASKAAKDAQAPIVYTGFDYKKWAEYHKAEILYTKPTVTSDTESEYSSGSDSDEEQSKKVKKPQLHVTTKPSTVDTQEQSASQSPISPSTPTTISQSTSTQSLRTPHIMYSSESDDDESLPPSQPLNNSYFKNMFAKESSPLFTKIVIGCAAIATFFALWQLNT
jgi:hypothetical protein